MSAHDAVFGESTELIVRCQDDRAVRARLCDLFAEDADCVHYAIEASAPGLNARLDGVAVWNWDADLTSFLEGLARDFRGWDGERVWQTDEGDLTIKAVFRSGGHVGLTWVLRPRRTSLGSWDASVTTWLEAGEQMSALAGDVRHFLGRR
ncbi:DUF6228 family protein [Streptomyces cocklensis]|jgi:hypothetical protein|uniref:Uncharacterized protein n=1 Tax=Actinacidiphila cocklensis TaxID=887465 RepID=A0A9W4DIG8_9ACTN|nr:DUF6228 family protein [Actinacidiphila cocklensis]MDD1062497.1 DUF6228 family protein [Actinacidiphila cocklensis]WSX72489.1 DUF6228 family protein [Streptomyces sp. NBC_00899]WSX81442.1 DUF6228 family protein [Streptomyces sp. NBC_00899]CAG6391966.1 conserved hypothetical protein [Actinacidiphila cocklensis]